MLSKDEEYELIPLSPIRRLEKRMEKIESTSPALDVGEFFRELVAIIRMNQEIVDELAKSNDSLRIELSKLPGKLQEVSSNLGELINYIKAATIEETVKPPSENLKPLTDKLDQLIDVNKKLTEGNETLVSLLESLEKKLRPPFQPLPARPFHLKPLIK